MTNTDKAKSILLKNQYTCVFCSDNETLISQKRGVKPLLEFYESKKDFSAFSAADKTVGAGAAHIYVLLGIRSLWANVISEEGAKILISAGVTLAYSKKVPYIINRAGNDRCPIEKCVMGIEDSLKALDVIKETLLQIMGM